MSIKVNLGKAYVSMSVNKEEVLQILEDKVYDISGVETSIYMHIDEDTNRAALVIHDVHLEEDEIDALSEVGINTEEWFLTSDVLTKLLFGTDEVMFFTDEILFSEDKNEFEVQGDSVTMEVPMSKMDSLIENGFIIETQGNM